MWTDDSGGLSDGSAGGDQGQGDPKRDANEAKAERLRRAGERLVQERVKQILAHDPRWGELLSKEAALREEVHHDRLRISKRTLSVENFSAKLQEVYQSLRQAHDDEKRHAAALAELHTRHELKRERVAARVRQELGLSGPLDD
jgi:hypothetical protein